MDGFLPVSRADMDARGWDQCDFVYVIGDAYVDHPTFGHAIISRILEAHGFRVGILSQPNWKDPASIQALGTPRLGFLVMGGNMDSMVNHYTVAKRRRSYDYFSPGGKMGLRPDYATIVYCNLIRQSYRDIPIIIGGIEASLRGWLITTIGRISSSGRSCWILKLTFCSTAWVNEASWRWPRRWTAVFPFRT